MHTIPKFPFVYQKFINDTVGIANDNGITIKFYDSDLVYNLGDKMGSAGYFSDEYKKLVVSTKNVSIEQLMSLFIHESCHMDQFLFDSVLWNKYTPGLAHFYEWLNKDRDLTAKEVKKYVQDVISIELDCEKRSVAKIKKYRLPIDIRKYKINANIYLFGILYCAEKGKWYNNIHASNQVWKYAPDRFRKKYDTIPQNLHVAFESYVTE